MATKHEQRRAKKQAARRQVSKEKQKKERTERASRTAGFNKLDPKKKHKSVYDLIEEGARLKRRAKIGEIPDTIITGAELLQGINDTITVAVKSHSGIVVYLKMVEEKRFELTEENRAFIENFERKLVEFSEDVNVVITLHEAGRKPDEYVEILLATIDVMHELVTLAPEAAKLAETQRDIIEQYVTEHIPTGVDMYSYMSMLHEERINAVRELYATGASQELLEDFRAMESLMTTVDDLEAVKDPENLEAPATEPVAEGEVTPPNDPVSQAAV